MQTEPQGGSQGHTAPEYAHRRVREKTSERGDTATPFRGLSLFISGARDPGGTVAAAHLQDEARSSRARTHPVQEGTRPRASALTGLTHSEPAPGPRLPSPHMSTKTMKHQPRPPTSSMVTWMP